MWPCRGRFRSSLSAKAKPELFSGGWYGAAWRGLCNGRRRSGTAEATDATTEAMPGLSALLWQHTVTVQGWKQ